MTRKTNREGAAQAAPEYALDTVSPVRHLVTTLAGSKGPLPVATIAGGYHHHPGDLNRVKLHEKCADDEAAKEWLILQAAKTLSRYIDVTDQDGVTLIGLRDGVTADKVRHNRKRVHLNIDDHAVFGDPFNPNSGELVQLRKDAGNLEGLIESMRAFGWLPELPAYRDERGVVLAGNRRLKAAEALGITPRIVKVTLGRGDEADAERVRLALGTNLGHKPLTKAERAKVAEYMTRYLGWPQQMTAHVLGVTQSTVSNDLSGIIEFDNSEKDEAGVVVAPEGVFPHTNGKRRGRPRGSSNKDALFEKYRDQIVEMLEAGVTQKQIEARLGISNTPVRRAKAWMEGQKLRTRPVSKPLTDAICTCPQCGHVHAKNPAEA